MNNFGKRLLSLILATLILLEPFVGLAMSTETEIRRLNEAERSVIESMDSETGEEKEKPKPIRGFPLIEGKYYGPVEKDHDQEDLPIYISWKLIDPSKEKLQIPANPNEETLIDLRAKEDPRVAFLEGKGLDTKAKIIEADYQVGDTLRTAKLSLEDLYKDPRFTFQVIDKDYENFLRENASKRDDVTREDLDRWIETSRNEEKDLELKDIKNENIQLVIKYNPENLDQEGLDQENLDAHVEDNELDEENKLDDLIIDLIYIRKRKRK